MTKEKNEMEDEVPFMRSLTYCLNKFVQQGYTENFQASEDGLYSLDSHKKYQPQDIKIVNYYRFEGVSNPDDNSILYIIETTDGARGTLVDAYGAYADPNVAQIIKQIEDIHRN